MTSAGSVIGAQSANHRTGGGANPTPALSDLKVVTIGVKAARRLIEEHHYLHSMPGGTQIAFGVLSQRKLHGVIVLGVGPFNAYQLVEGARPEDCLTLTRYWLSDELPRNSESKVLGIVLRNLKKHTELKFIVTYADPEQGHIGTIYMGANFVYTGLSSVASRYDLGDGVRRHSRSLAHAFGTHSIRHFEKHGMQVKVIPQSPKHRYIYFLDPTWKASLKPTSLPYPKNN